MKKFLSTFLFFLAAQAVSAQTISAVVVDEQHLPIPYSTVSVLSSDSVFLAGVTTGDDGKFLIQQPAEAETIKVTSIGYQDFVSSIALLTDTIVMRADSETLQTVQVVAQRQIITNEVDRISYDMQADPESKTKNVMDMLRKVPLVAVDGQENITVNGSSAFKIYKNGHPDNSLGTNAKDVLKAIPASMIKKIEVITEPGAKYDAEGVTAILNIVMVDNSNIKGITATVNGKVVQDGSAQLGAYLTTQTGKLITTVTYGVIDLKERGARQRYLSEKTYVETGYKDYYSNSQRMKGNVHFTDVESSYEIDSLNLISASVGGYFYKIDVTGNSFDSQHTADGDLLYSYESRILMPGHSFSEWHGRADYEHRTHRKDEVLTLSYMLSTTRSKNDRENTFLNMVNMPVDYTGYNQRMHEQFYEHTAQIDYVLPLSENHKIDMGGKYIYRLNKSQTTMLYDGIDHVMNNDFDHNTQVAAAYMQYRLSLGKFSAQAGLRYEYSFLEARYKDGSMDNYHTHLSDWVPTLNMAYQISQANSLKLTYATSINRPGITYLNPAVVESVRSVSFGNALLSSSRNQSLSMTFMHIGQKITYNVQPHILYVNNGIGEMRYVRDNINYSTYGNIMKRRDAGVSGYAQVMPWKGMTMMFNGSVDYRNLKNPSLQLSTRGWTSNIWSNLTQQLPWKLRLSLGAGGAIGRQPNDVYGYTGAWKYYYGGLSRSFLKEDRLSVSINFQNLFDKNQHWKNYTTQGDVHERSRGSSHSRQVGLSISYRLGKLNAQVKKTSSTIENDDVLGGIEKKQ